MKAMIDNFSTEAENYAAFRPIFPEDFISELVKKVHYSKKALDVGTGNGQIANILKNSFDQVYGIDISEEQLKNAIPADNIDYRVSRAEQTPFYDNYFDLITVGQAFHWFDFEAFFTEVKRILKPGGLLAIFGYGLHKGDDEFNEKLFHFYENVIGDFWDKERIYIEKEYKNVDFPFTEETLSKDFEIKVRWTPKQLEGYLKSWSAVKKYKEKNQKNPVDDFMAKLTTKETYSLKFPVFYRIGRM
ncbi:class I SAM-dependent methyltransferase [Galbibacter mesophilus]|uniref:class I SAM-dependent methyltransferase n=1 Tax=Galbibacter mesophilus TaxID=379069 RepID=UPI00191DB056|nr:class I SAM-dependent methyltransferase [Galbibacter mesophilus]MCM5661668.1 methyltransferase domain-containing protein [Galbibacter mesophilus]